MNTQITNYFDEQLHVTLLGKEHFPVRIFKQYFSPFAILDFSYPPISMNFPAIPHNARNTILMNEFTTNRVTRRRNKKRGLCFTDRRICRSRATLQFERSTAEIAVPRRDALIARLTMKSVNCDNEESRAGSRTKRAPFSENYHPKAVIPSFPREIIL